MPRRAPPPPPPLDLLMARLNGLADPDVRAGMGRYAIPNDKALGIPVGTLRALGKELGRHHDLALALWATDVYEARLLACFVDDPALVTPAQMDRWIGDADSWAVCDTACFALFDQTAHVFDRVHAWAPRDEEFVRRGAFALLASVALHGKKLDDAPFLAALPLCEAHATDPRNFVKKGVSWAIRGVGERKSAVLKAEVAALAERLVASPDKTARWIGKDVQRELSKRAAKAT